MRGALPADAAARLRRHVKASMETKRRLPGACEPAILEAAARIAETLAAGGKILLAGNGGSAADAQHIAAEFVGRLSAAAERPALAAIALTTDTSVLTALANDYGFAHVFARQLEALGRPGDLFVGLSTSGDSENVLRAAGRARELGIATVGLTGAGGGRLAAACDLCIAVPSGVTQHVQEAHIMIGHVLCDLAARALGYASGDPAAE
jgi:D-sedoheptulose 7-phosphate isomerase